MSTWFILLSQFCILAFAIVGGVFLAFSDFIMRSLAIARPPAGIEVMQVINREVFRWIFMPLFLGMAGVSLVVIGYAWLHLSGFAATLILTAAMIYLVGVFGVTVVFNVPLNKELARMDVGTDEALSFWKTKYLTYWTFWNSVRTASSIVAASIYLLGFVWLAQA